MFVFSLISDAVSWSRRHKPSVTHTAQLQGLVAPYTRGLAHLAPLLDPAHCKAATMLKSSDSFVYHRF